MGKKGKKGGKSQANLGESQKETPTKAVTHLQKGEHKEQKPQKLNQPGGSGQGDGPGPSERMQRPPPQRMQQPPPQGMQQPPPEWMQRPPFQRMQLHPQRMQRPPFQQMQQPPPQQIQQPPPQQMQQPPLQRMQQPHPQRMQRPPPSQKQQPSFQQEVETSLPEKMEGMSVSPRMPLRQGVGTVGRQIQVDTNHLLLTISNYNINIYQYDVDIHPEKPYRLYRQVFLEFQKRNFPNHPLAYDNRKCMFTVSELKGKLCDSISIIDPEKSSTQPPLDYTVTISCVNQFTWRRVQDYFKTGDSTNPPQIEIQALDIVLRQAAYARQQIVPVGRSFFTPPEGQPLQLGNGLVLWRGIYQSAILGWKPYLNVDVAHKGFPEPVPCTEALKNICGIDLDNPLEHYHKRNFEQYMKGLKVVYEIPRQRNTRRVYKVSGLDEPPVNKSFDMEGEKITVENYFSIHKRHRLRYPKLPCLQVGTKGTCLPLELCTIDAGQSVMRKLDERQTAAMVKAAARPTIERKEHIMGNVKKIDYNSNNCVTQFGITVSDQFAKVKARILDPPSLDYSGKQVRVQNGVWNPERFTTGGTCTAWAVLEITSFRSSDKERLASELVKTAKNLGVELNNASVLNEIRVKRYDPIEKKLIEQFTEYKKKKIDFVVVIIPNDNYGKVKFTAELTVGILTQCIKARTVERLNFSVVKNILLKINAKLNGANHSILKNCSEHFQLMKRPVMICGADVTHPSPGQDSPSVAAVTASFDIKAFKYNVEWRIQASRDEVIRDLKNIMINHLKHFERMTNYKPEKLVFYRDGVSEGQFSTILKEELSAIRAACTSLNKEYKPKITFLVVQKRHHTRFFPAPRDADGKNKNVPAGTIVDTEITHPRERDFYLVSHASIQGTSRPTKYHVLWDDSNMSEDELQVTTYFLCHIFTRCCRSVSYPAPTYYAHLAAFRIRAYAECAPLEKLDKNDTYLRIQEAFKRENPMFYV